MVTLKLIRYSLVGLMFSTILFFWAPGSVWAVTYTSSAHAGGGTATALQRTTMTSYAAGNCAHCHEQHASVLDSAGASPLTSVEPNPTGGPDSFLGMDLEQDLCLGCHGGVTNYSNTGSPDNINANITNDTYKHDLTTSDSAHLANETLAQLDDTAHVECTDCHNPHTAQNVPHVIGVNTILTTSPLYGVSGAEVDDITGAWPTRTQANYTLVSVAAKEYEVCFKCHSSANANLTTWDATWTDVAKEFSTGTGVTGNDSYHPVMAVTDAADNRLTDADQMGGTYWGTTGLGQTMYCSDCHGSDDSNDPEGPHGSQNESILRVGTYPRKTASVVDKSNLWSLTDFSANGKDSPFTLPSGLLCGQCHKMLETTNKFSNKVHNYHIGHYGGTATADRVNIACVTCHSGNPHGSQHDRLMALDTDPAPYDHGNNSAWLTKFVQCADEDSCYTANSTYCTTKAGYPGGSGPDPCDSVHP